MTRIGMAAILVALAGAISLSAADARAQTAPQGVRMAQASPPLSDASAQRRVRRPATRLRVYPRYEWEPDVYPRYNPGPNAVRECNATYVQEYRPSGTVIVPRMNCYWRRG
jgi:lipoprotein-anchoring transpeptidase ErfK/SrfK